MTMPALVLIGAQSRAGRAILRAWPGAVASLVHRGDGPGVRVADYGDVPAHAIPPGSVVINCVGTPTGSEAALFRLNRDVAIRWAEAANAGGACQFVQLSSFSVYGRAEQIDAGTPDAAITGYGRSKLAADRALLAMDRPGFAVTIVRIPMLFGDGQSKLARLVRAVRKVRVIPVVTPAIERSMLGYDALAVALADLVRRSAHGIVHVADPTVFTYDLLRSVAARGRHPRRLFIPRFVVSAAKRLAPSLHASIFASSRLAPYAAYPVTIPEGATLEHEIARLAEEARTDPVRKPNG